MNHLLLKFPRRNSPYGITRNTLRSLARKLGVSETMVIYLAISRFSEEIFSRHKADDRRLTVSEIIRIRDVAKPMLPKGRVIRHPSLLASERVRHAVAQMQAASPVLNQKEWDILASYEGPIVSGDPEGRVPDNLDSDDNE